MNAKRSAGLKAHEDDEVTQAGLDSFPASDSPAFNQSDPRERRRAYENAEREARGELHSQRRQRYRQS